MAGMKSTMSNQAEDLRSLRGIVQGVQSQLDTGITVTSTGDGSASESAIGQSATGVAGDAFRRAKLVRAQEGLAEGDWYVQAFSASLKTITPFVPADANSRTVQNYVLESLLKRNPDTLEWDGLLAKSWQTSDDGLTIDFTLRDNIVFSDGAPLTAADVEFTFAFMMDERIAAPATRAYYDKITAVEALDKNTVRFVFGEPYFNPKGFCLVPAPIV